MTTPMTDQQMDVLIRRLDVGVSPNPAFVEASLERLAPAVRSARRGDGRPFGAFWSMPTRRLAIVVAIGLLAMIGAVVAGSALLRDRLDGPKPDGLESRVYQGIFTPVLSGPASGSYTGAALDDGRVVLFYGSALSDPDGRTLTVLDPTTGEETSAGRTLMRRSGLTLLPIDSRRVLVVGGDLTPPGPDGSSLAAPSTAEVVDLAEGTSTPAGAMAAVRAWPTGIRLADGRILITGGLDYGAWEPVASAEVYDPGTNTFTAVGAMAAARQGHTMVPLPDGRVLVAGGTRGIGPPEIFDPATGSFSPTAATVTQATSDGPAVARDDGRAIVFRGACEETGPSGHHPSAVDWYDPATDSWAAAPAVPNCVETATALPNGEILLTGYYWARGSEADDGCMRRDRPLAEGLIGWSALYHPVTGVARVTTPPQRFGQQAVPLKDGRVLFLGGSICDASHDGSGDIFQ